MECTEKDISYTGLPSLSVCQPILVCLETGESNGHLRNNSWQNSTKTLVQCKRRLAFYNVRSSSKKASGFCLTVMLINHIDQKVISTHARRKSRLGKLHPDLDGIEGLTYDLKKREINCSFIGDDFDNSLLHILRQILQRLCVWQIRQAFCYGFETSLNESGWFFLLRRIRFTCYWSETNF